MRSAVHKVAYLQGKHYVVGQPVISVKYVQYRCDDSNKSYHYKEHTKCLRYLTVCWRKFRSISLYSACILMGPNVSSGYWSSSGYGYSKSFMHSKNTSGPIAEFYDAIFKTDFHFYACFCTLSPVNPPPHSIQLTLLSSILWNCSLARSYFYYFCFRLCTRSY